MSSAKSRYRPAFSAKEVEALATILLEAYIDNNTKPPYDPDRPKDGRNAFSEELQLTHYELIGKINTLRAKIANNAINPAYITSKHSNPAIATLESLGAPAEQVAIAAGTEPKEVYWKRCYDKYLADPYSCTVQEIDGYNEHRYLNDLMDAEEVLAHENKPTRTKGAV